MNRTVEFYYRLLRAHFVKSGDTIVGSLKVIREELGAISVTLWRLNNSAKKVSLVARDVSASIRVPKEPIYYVQSSKGKTLLSNMLFDFDKILRDKNLINQSNSTIAQELFTETCTDPFIPTYTRRNYNTSSAIPDYLKTIKADQSICIPILKYDPITHEYPIIKNAHEATDAMVTIHFSQSAIHKSQNSKELSAVFLSKFHDLNPEQRFLRLKIQSSIARHLRLVMSYSRLLRSKVVLNRVAERYGKKSNESLSKIIRDLLTDSKFIYDHVPYAGASLFVYDPFTRNYFLKSTTGVYSSQKRASTLPSYITQENPYAFYEAGEYLTGQVGFNPAGEPLKPMVLANLDRSEQVHHVAKFSEIEMSSNVHSWLGIPLIRPSAKMGSHALGILRFTNKLNLAALTLDQEVPDYFHPDDVSLLTELAELIALYVETELEVKERQVYVSKLKHEIESPIDAFLVNMDVLLDYKDELTEEEVSYLTENSFELAQHMFGIIKGIGYLEGDDKTKAQRYNVKEAIKIKDVINSSINLLKQTFKEKNIDYTKIQIHDELDELFIDRTAFEQVFRNLIRNSINYRDYKVEFELNIKCEVTVKYENGNIQESFTIRITDNGLGFEKIEKENVFDYGFRGHAGLVETGTGFGLSLSRKVISDFGGRIYIENIKNPTILRIDLPKFLVSDNYLKDNSWNTNQFT